jgi:predicted small integral membrane protein
MKFFQTISLLLAAMALVVLASPAAEPRPTAIASPADSALLETLNTRAIDLTEISGLVKNLTSTLSTLGAILTQDTLTEVKSILDHANDLLDDKTTKDLKSVVQKAAALLNSDLLSKLGGVLSPALLTNVTDILGGAHDLLTPNFVSNTKTLIADATPVRLL